MIGAIVLSLEGQVQSMSTLAEELIHSYFPSATVHGQDLPDLLRRWVQRQLDSISMAQADQALRSSPSYRISNGGTHQLMVRLSLHPEPGKFLLLLEEAKNRDLSAENLRHLGLTKREAEVLILVGQSKTPVEIAEVLVMSDRTVKKHLQHIYRKFRVQNRLSAIMYALEKLDIIPQEAEPSKDLNP
jgi:DNA-binding CsgD family transcriptional regulator